MEELSRTATAGLLAELEQAVRAVARAEIMPRYLKVTHSRKDDGSLFTEADLAAQTALVADLRALVDCPVLGEEMTDAEQRELWISSDTGLWCVDPIDGTSNFVKGLPCFAVSVALIRAGRPVLGVVYNPACDEMFSAAAGQGATLNGEPLATRADAPALKRTIAGIDFKRLAPDLAARLVARPPYSSQRNYGSSALDWCYVAASRYDIYLHGGQKVWDYAAGALILEEAGGAVCTLARDQFWLDDVWCRSAVAAANPVLLAAWRDWLRQPDNR